MYPFNMYPFDKKSGILDYKPLFLSISTKMVFRTLSLINIAIITILLFFKLYKLFYLNKCTMYIFFFIIVFIIVIIVFILNKIRKYENKRYKK